MRNIEIRRPVVTLSALVFGLFALWYLLVGPSSPTGNMGSTAPASYTYKTVPGYFAQDDSETDEKTYDYQKHNFGLIDQEYESEGSSDQHSTQWQRFTQHVDHLISSSPAGTTYKVLYLGRHGEGFHNLGEAKYGTKAWDDYWSKLDGDGDLFWDDAHLTAKGKQQALSNNAFLKRQFSEAKMPLPAKYFTSPLYRCLQTANLTYSGIELPASKSFVPLIKELMREVMGEHTCDRRSSRTVIHDAFPDWPIEVGFSEKDELWQADHRETHAEHDARTQEMLDDVFEHAEDVFLSFTSHSGAIASLLRVTGHREFRLQTGGMMPILVKATKRS